VRKFPIFNYRVTQDRASVASGAVTVEAPRMSGPASHQVSSLCVQFPDGSRTGKTMEEHWSAARDKNTNEFKLHLTDAHSALNLQKSGWELGERPFDKKENAKKHLQEWKKRFEEERGLRL
jgi:hypothetical protein